MSFERLFRSVRRDLLLASRSESFARYVSKIREFPARNTSSKFSNPFARRGFAVSGLCRIRLFGRFLTFVPTLVLTGDLDQLISPQNSRIIASLIPGARLIIIPEMWSPPDVEGHRRMRRLRHRIPHQCLRRASRQCRRSRAPKTEAIELQSDDRSARNFVPAANVIFCLVNEWCISFERRPP